ncbi:MAG: DUF1800 family protein, partial [Chitinophagaceae bacterium]
PITDGLKFPYRASGLTERQAAAHLLNRFTYSATPAQIDAVVKMGLEKWFEAQLEGKLSDDSLNLRLSAYPDLDLTNQQVLSIYPQNNVVVQMAIKDSVINKDSVGRAIDKKGYNDQLKNYMDSKGLKSDQLLFACRTSMSFFIFVIYSSEKLYTNLHDAKPIAGLLPLVNTHGHSSLPCN